MARYSVCLSLHVSLERINFVLPKLKQQAEYRHDEVVGVHEREQPCVLSITVTAPISCILLLFGRYICPGNFHLAYVQGSCARCPRGVQRGALASQ